MIITAIIQTREADRARVILTDGPRTLTIAVEQGPGSVWYCVIDERVGHFPNHKPVRLLSIPCHSRHMAAVFAAAEVEEAEREAPRAMAS